MTWGVKELSAFQKELVHYSYGPPSGGQSREQIAFPVIVLVEGPCGRRSKS